MDTGTHSHRPPVLDLRRIDLKSSGSQETERGRMMRKKRILSFVRAVGRLREWDQGECRRPIE